MDRRLKQKSPSLVKVVIFGPESTGKTTLANQLAYHYQTVWVPEYARDYLQEKWNTKRQVCEHEDLMPIALGQIKCENKLAKLADKILICDTDLLETKIYSEEYYDGKVDPVLEEAVREHQYDLYLLAGIDVPWEFDTLRDRPGQRKKMFDAFENGLKAYHRNYIILTGDKNERFEKAVKAIDKLVKEKRNLYSYSESEDIQVTRRKSFFSKFFNSNS